MQSSKKSITVLTCAMLAAFNVLAQTPSGPAAPAVTTLLNVQPSVAVTSQQVETVEQLLQLDSKIALEKAREKAVKLLPQPPTPIQAPAAIAPAPDLIEVISVMGTAGEKTATIAINGKVYSRVALGSVAGPYSVTGVGDGCVSLAKQVPKAKSRKQAAKQPPAKRVCFDFQAEREASIESISPPLPGVPGGAGRGMLTPLPLPTIPAVLPAPGGSAAVY